MAVTARQIRNAMLWITHEWEETDPRHRPELTATDLAERAADRLGINDQPGPLDDPNHEIWDIAVEVYETMESQ
jgi:hypothetical protein